MCILQKHCWKRSTRPPNADEMSIYLLRISLHAAKARRPLPPLSLVSHGIGDLDETGNVGSGDQGRDGTTRGELGSSLPTSLVAGDHDVLELCVDLCWSPGESLRVLSHFKTRDGDTTTVGGFTGSVEDDTLLVVQRLDGRSSLFENVNGLLGATHVGTLGDISDTGLDQCLGLLGRDLVLGSGRKGDIGLFDQSPRSLALVVGELALGTLPSSQALSVEFDVGDSVDVLGGETGVVVSDEGTGRVGEGEDDTSKLNDLQGGVLSDVSGTGNEDSLSLPVGVVEVLQHLSDVVDQTETGSFGSDEGSTPRSTFTSEDTGKLVSDLLVGTEHVTNLSSSSSDISSGDISVVTNVSGQLLHKGVALGSEPLPICLGYGATHESSNLIVGLALGVKVTSTFTTTHHQTRQGILEDLFKTQEFQDGEVDSGVQSESTFVRSKSRVELNSVTSVDFDRSVVSFPGDSELDDSFGNLDDFEGSSVLWLLLEELQSQSYFTTS